MRWLFGIPLAGVAVALLALAGVCWIISALAEWRELKRLRKLHGMPALHHIEHRPGRAPVYVMTSGMERSLASEVWASSEARRYVGGTVTASEGKSDHVPDGCGHSRMGDAAGGAEMRRNIEGLVNQALELVRSEVLRAIDKHPPMHSPHEGWAVIREELDELWDEVRKQGGGRSEEAMTEARHVAAMAVRYIVDLENEFAD